MGDTQYSDIPVEEWLSARESLKLVHHVAKDHSAHRTICQRAHVGMIRAKAEKFIQAGRDMGAVELPPEFWWAKGREALSQNWEAGDFDTWINKKYHWQAFGVEFLTDDIMKLIPKDTSGLSVLSELPEEETNTSGKSAGGRARSENWTTWIAELAHYIHYTGIPEGEGSKGQESIIKAIESSAIEQGLEVPASSTVKSTVRAVLLRIRSGEN